MLFEVLDYARLVSTTSGSGPLLLLAGRQSGCSCCRELSPSRRAAVLVFVLLSCTVIYATVYVILHVM